MEKLPTFNRILESYHRGIFLVIEKLPVPLFAMDQRSIAKTIATLACNSIAFRYASFEMGYSSAKIVENVSNSPSGILMKFDYKLHLFTEESEESSVLIGNLDFYHPRGENKGRSGRINLRDLQLIKEDIGEKEKTEDSAELELGKQSAFISLVGIAHLQILKLISSRKLGGSGVVNNESIEQQNHNNSNSNSDYRIKITSSTRAHELQIDILRLVHVAFKSSGTKAGAGSRMALEVDDNPDDLCVHLDVLPYMGNYLNQKVFSSKSLEAMFFDENNFSVAVNNNDTNTTTGTKEVFISHCRSCAATDTCPARGRQLFNALADFDPRFLEHQFSSCSKSRRLCRQRVKANYLAYLFDQSLDTGTDRKVKRTLLGAPQNDSETAEYRYFRNVPRTIWHIKKCGNVGGIVKCSIILPPLRVTVETQSTTTTTTTQSKVTETDEDDDVEFFSA